jgi:pyruvate/2-oxoglutarate dehydrogenase complex dihydrolipoamide dehydrogenase (E3) component
MYDIAIIGYGITGMLTLAILQQYKFDLSKVCVIDPYYDGGALMRDYGNVVSNTPLSKLITALQSIKPEYTIPEEYSSYDVNKITPLYILTNIIKDFTKSFLKQVDKYETKVINMNYNIDYTLETENGTTIKARAIICCQGSSPKTLSCNIPIIPLHVALNPEILKQYVKPNDKIILFGTSHSGTLILENLHKLNIQTTAIHKSNTPFLFAKDGEYDGIKEEAERIANQILNNEYINLKLLNISEIDKVIKASKDAHWVIYSIGFETQKIPGNFDIKKYNSTSGKILGIEKAYGFGIAYPSLAPDSIHVDVGVSSFVEHIQKQMEELKKLLY